MPLAHVPSPRTEDFPRDVSKAAERHRKPRRATTPQGTRVAKQHAAIYLKQLAMRFAMDKAPVRARPDAVSSGCSLGPRQLASATARCALVPGEDEPTEGGILIARHRGALQTHTSPNMNAAAGWPRAAALAQRKGQRLILVHALADVRHRPKLVVTLRGSPPLRGRARGPSLRRVDAPL